MCRSTNCNYVFVKNILIAISLGWLLLCTACGVYTFSGSSLPGHLKTVDIPLFVNESLQPNIAETITDRITQKVLSANLLRIVSEKGDATIHGTVTKYSHAPYTYSHTSARDLDVSEYAVRITVDLEFRDNKEDQPLYKGTIEGEGIYLFDSETEETGQTRAIDDLVERILQNSIQSW